jgi:hypothetical protein
MIAHVAATFSVLATLAAPIAHSPTIVKASERVRQWIPITAGGSAGYQLGPRELRGPTAGGELVGVVSIVDEIAPLWYALGYRAVWSEAGTQHMPYAELGAWFIASLGVGYSLEWGVEGVVHRPHLYLGLPIPLVDLRDALGFSSAIYISPYTRLGFRFGATVRVLPESGIMLKLVLPHARK